MTVTLSSECPKRGYEINGPQRELVKLTKLTLLTSYRLQSLVPVDNGRSEYDRDRLLGVPPRACTIGGLPWEPAFAGSAQWRRGSTPACCPLPF